MDNYTEKELKKLNKDGLIKIATENEIEAPDGATNAKIIELILEKGCTSAVDDGLPKYGKGYFMKSNWYSHKRDILDELLEDGKEYSISTVEKLIARK